MQPAPESAPVRLETLVAVAHRFLHTYVYADPRATILRYVRLAPQFVTGAYMLTFSTTQCTPDNMRRAVEPFLRLLFDGLNRAVLSKRAFYEKLRAGPLKHAQELQLDQEAPETQSQLDALLPQLPEDEFQVLVSFANFLLFEYTADVYHTDCFEVYCGEFMRILVPLIQWRERAFFDKLRDVRFVTQSGVHLGSLADLYADFLARLHRTACALQPLESPKAPVQ